jgi:hypothetical protein
MAEVIGLEKGVENRKKEEGRRKKEEGKFSHSPILPLPQSPNLPLSYSLTKVITVTSGGQNSLPGA